MIREGQSWPLGVGIIGEAVLDVEPSPGERVTLAAALTEHDGGLFGDDDSLGVQTFDAYFETGWRRDVDLLLTGDGGTTVKLTFGLEPI